MRADFRLLASFGAADAQDAWLLSRLTLVLLGFCLVRLLLMMRADCRLLLSFGELILMMRAEFRLLVSFGAADAHDAWLLSRLTLVLLGFC